jgi:hypothetical protein
MTLDNAPKPAKHVHQVFIISGVVDEAVVRKQAYARANRPRLVRNDNVVVQEPERTAVHKHKQGQRCNESCYLIHIGEQER